MLNNSNLYLLNSLFQFPSFIAHNFYDLGAALMVKYIDGIL
jgi:hypothetical protein